MSEIFRHTKKNVLKLFRKLSLSNLKPVESTGACANTKYKHQKNNSVSISPTNVPKTVQKKASSRKRDHRKHKVKAQDDEDEDFTDPTPGKHRRNYIRKCLKRLNNNYEKQINCLQDENVVFTDNKIYISLARNTSITSNSFENGSLKKNRRVIYPSRGYALNGFLRNYDFSFESPTRECGTSETEAEEKLKFNVTGGEKSKNVVFEKVKIPARTNQLENIEGTCTCSHAKINGDEGNDDSLLTSSTFLTDWNNFESKSYDADTDEDDVQWKNFLELRRQTSSSGGNSTSMTLSDSGFGSQLFQSNKTNRKALDTWVDDESFDNSFNEELEQKVSIMYPSLQSKTQKLHFNNKSEQLQD